MRFGGTLKMVKIPGTALANVMTRTNQFTAKTLDGRIGNCVHVAKLDVDPSKSYRFLVNGWTALNQKAYLCTEDLAYEDIPDLELKEVVAAHLGAIFPN